MKISVRLTPMLVLLPACGTTQPVQASDVLALTVCPSDGGLPCNEVADGVSTIPIQACVPATVTAPLATGLTLTMLASAGTWQNPASPTTPTTFTAVLSGNRCVTANLVAPTTALFVNVNATLAGYTQSAVVPLKAAPLRGVALTASPAILTSATTNLVSLTAVVQAEGAGTASAGTAVRFQATPSPPTAYATVEPANVLVGSASSASATLVLGPGVRWVSVLATATPPPTSAGDAGAATGCITVDVVTPDAGAPDATAHGCNGG
jgi:hypothetical protein